MATHLTYGNNPQPVIAPSRAATNRAAVQPGHLAPGLETPITLKPAHPLYLIGKRVTDISVAAIATVIFAPVIAIIALLIRLDSPGPAIFRQQRVGHGGRTFTFYKFRTMYADAKERFPELYDYRYSTEQWNTLFYKLPEDPRMTRFGRIVRKTTLDELPNLFNVLKGDMSLVGPRPELPDYVEYYTPAQLAKFSVRAGVTGLAQSSGRGTLPVQDQIAADLEYVARSSFWFDVKILARTVAMVVRGVGAF